MAPLEKLVRFSRTIKLSDVLRRSLHINTQRVVTEEQHIFEYDDTFKASDISIQLTTAPKPKPPVESLFFGQNYSDHMFTVKWTKDGFWETPEIKPLADLSLHPGAKVLQYCTQTFEGLKAYRGYDNKIRLFRPMDNMRRFYTSTERAGLPLFDPEELLLCIKKLISVDESWVPEATPDVASSLYIRPTFIATQPTLGVDISNSALMYVLIGPSGPYYSTGFKPIALLADPKFVRAWPGGVGCYKMGVNYAPTINIQNVARSQGCSQILWLYGEQQEVTEVGSMNLFIYLINEQGEKELITAPIESGLILPGVTRQSVLDLTRQWDEFKVSERKFTMKELIKAIEEKRIIEVMGSGTAVVICPVNKIKYDDKWYPIPSDDTLATRLYDELMGIQYGTIKSDWMVDLD